MCTYGIYYADGSVSIGVLATESIHFGSQTIKFPNFTFGCGLYNNFAHRTSDKVTGIVGLGAGPLSLVSQIGDKIGHKFSYCLLPFSSNSPTKLKFGNEATIQSNGVVSAPLIIDPSFPSYYFLQLEGVSVGQQMVQTNGKNNN
ncbi:hypothetical protein VNO78_13252 [Psophocarpus tetragonolobus]|uniref:Xylanase inhibitor N-terminal domain-containing protein n=1 Tax=Psophocarpus tetragonolobus TaxID=3891 RepID=A0AAN9SP08_PSOTE